LLWAYTSNIFGGVGVLLPAKFDSAYHMTTNIPSFYEEEMRVED
jgi:hypothetical protein